MFLNACNDYGFLASISMIKTLFEVVCILVPVALIVFVGIDLFKGVTNKEGGLNEDQINKIIGRFVMASIIFFIPMIINALMSLLDTTQVMDTACWENANSTQVALLKEQKEAELQAEKDQNEAENKTAEKLREEVEKIREEENEKNKQKAEEELENRTKSTSSGQYVGDIVYYNQGDYANVTYYASCGSIASCGCGPTSCAIISSTMLGASGHEPPDTTSWICGNGYCYSSGTDASGNAAYLKHEGLEVSESYTLSSSTESIFNEALSSGDSMIIMLAHEETGNCPFTNGGHYFVIYGVEDGEYKVADPASRERTTAISGQTWPISSFYQCGSRLFYIATKK